LPAPFFAKSGGSASLREQAIEDRLVRPRMTLVAQEADEPRAQSHPIVQQAARQNSLQFFNPGVSHEREDYSRKSEGWKWNNKAALNFSHGN
jgi:hypothetical protein